jgi:hypothetical protein
MVSFGNILEIIGESYGIVENQLEASGGMLQKEKSIN